MGLDTQGLEKEKIRIKKPSKFKVIMYNDDFTSMDFVIYILVKIFNKDNDEAFNLMMNVHKGGSAIVGVYSYDIAKTKVEKSLSLAKDEGYPFRIKVEEA